MKKLMFDLLAEDITLDTEIDELYDVLEPISPPPDFVEQVMQKVAHLPLPALPKIPWSHLSNLVVEVMPASLL